MQQLLGLKRILLGVFSLLFLFGGGFFIVKVAESATPFRILVISSYDYSYSTIPDQLNGFKRGISGLPVEIDYEFMDAKNYGSITNFM